MKFGDTRTAQAPTEDAAPTDAPAPAPTRLRFRDVRRETSPEPAKPFGDTRDLESQDK